MANHYVDSAASGGEDGSISTPWNTLAQVNAHSFSPDDAILLKCGSLFRESLVIGQAGTEGHPITYGSYDSGALPIICGADLYGSGSWSVHSGNVWKATANAWDSILVLLGGEYGYPEATLDALDTNGDYYWESNTVYVYSSGGNPATVWGTVEIAARARGIWTNDVANKDWITLEDIRLYGFGMYYGWTGYCLHPWQSSHWTITGLTCDKSAAFGLSSSGSNYIDLSYCTMTGFANTLQEWGQTGIRITRDTIGVTVTHNHIHHNTIQYYANSGISIGGYSDYLYSAEYNEIDHNDVSHCCSGIYPGKANHTLVHHNTCDDNLQRRVYGEEYGLALETGSDNEWYNNIVTNGRVGIELWGYETDEIPAFEGCGPVDRNKVYNNFFSGNSIDAIHIYEGCSDDSKIYNNIIVNNHGGIFINEHNTTGTGNVVYNNTLYNNVTDYPNLYLGMALAGWTFRNNISYSLTDYCLRSPNAITQAVHDHNLYYRASGNVIQNYTTDYTLAQVTTFEATAVASDPLFVNGSGTLTEPTDFAIPSNSPAKNAGAVINFGEDYWGNKRSTDPDIGAHEYVTPSATVQEGATIQVS